MRQKSVHPESPSERIVKNIRRATRKRHSSEEKIRIVLDGLRGEVSIAELCRREGIAESLYYAWSKEFLEAGKRRLAGDTARAATNGEVKDLRHEAQELKAVVAEQALELRLLKKSMIADVSTGTELSQNVGFQFSLGGDGGVSGISRYRDRGLPFREVFRGAFALAVD